MKIPTPQEIQAVVDALPVDLSNPGMQTLIRWMHDNSVEMQPMHYTLPFLALAAATASAPQTINVDSSAPFMLVQQEVFAAHNPVLVATSATQVQPSATVLITDLQSGRNWQNGATPILNIFGTAQRPYFYPQPRLMAANSALSVTVTNLDTVDDVDIWLTFSGYRFYS